MQLFLCDNLNENNLENLFLNIVINNLILYLDPLSKIYIVGNDKRDIDYLKK